MTIDVVLKKANSPGDSAEVKLIFSGPKRKRKVNLSLNFSLLEKFSSDSTSPAFDLFLISAIVYGIDNLVERYSFSVDAWARELQVCFPVKNVSVWNREREKLQKILTFLTGDYWDISFSKRKISTFYKPKKSTVTPSKYSHAAYRFASLFSGGLDSLVGVIDQLELLAPGHKALLISHFDSTSPGPKADQLRLFEYLTSQQRYGDKAEWLQQVVALPAYDNNGMAIRKESSFRSRSFLFLGLGVFCVNSIPNCQTLLVPENGTISLNYPLTPSRSSTLSTRTTHPHYLNLLQDLVLAIGLNVTLRNPYKNQTKGELVQACGNQSVLRGILEKSVSCGKRGRKMAWDNRSGTSHCGVCMPCIYRRAALHKTGSDTQLYGIDIFTTTKPILSIQDMPALFDFLKRPLTRDQIKKTLLVNGSLKMDELDSSAALVERVRTEIKQWISTKGNSNLRQLAGV